MGITLFDTKLIKTVIDSYKIKSVLELGSQNLYINGEKNPPFADGWYKENGIEHYISIDLAGDNNSLQLHLEEELNENMQFDLVTDFGTSEHVVKAEAYETTAFHDGYINSVYPDTTKSIDIDTGFYNCWKNKFNFLKEEGIMINVNPKSGNWPGHGYAYYTKEFYRNLEAVSGLKIILIDENPAMGNTTDGWNIICIMQKINNTFPDIHVFKDLGYTKQ